MKRPADTLFATIVGNSIEITLDFENNLTFCVAIIILALETSQESFVLLMQ